MRFLAHGSGSGFLGFAPIRGEADERYIALLSRRSSAIHVAAASLLILGTSSSAWADGAESITCDGLAATIVGTEGDDLLRGTPAPDVIAGLGGNDVIKGRAGDDTICGGDGTDSIRGGAGADHIYGNSGDDDLSGNGGNDELRGGSGNDSMSGGYGNDLLSGGAGADAMWGSPGRDVLNGGSEDDILRGELGWDRLRGALGNDTLLGGAGNDRLRGGGGDDTLAGEAGNDYLDGGADTDGLTGGDGTDLCVNGETEAGCEPTWHVDLVLIWSGTGGNTRHSLSWTPGSGFSPTPIDETCVALASPPAPAPDGYPYESLIVTYTEGVSVRIDIQGELRPVQGWLHTADDSCTTPDSQGGGAVNWFQFDVP